MIRFTRLRLRRSSGTVVERATPVHLFLCRIDFPPAGRTVTSLDWRIDRRAHKPPKWMPKPTSCTFSLKNWPYGDGPV